MWQLFIGRGSCSQLHQLHQSASSSVFTIAILGFQPLTDPFLPINPSPEIQEEPLEERLRTPPATPIHSPHAFLKEDRWLFSPPPMLTSEHVKLDNSEIGLNVIDNTDKRRKSPALRKRAARPKSLVLSSEEKPPRKGVRPTTTSTPLDLNLQETSEPSTSIEIKNFSVPPFLLARPVPLSVGTEPVIWNPPPLLQIVSHPTSDLVRRLTTSCMSYVSPPAYQTNRK